MYLLTHVAKISCIHVQRASDSFTCSDKHKGFNTQLFSLNIATPIKS